MTMSSWLGWKSALSHLECSATAAMTVTATAREPCLQSVGAGEASQRGSLFRAAGLLAARNQRKACIDATPAAVPGTRRLFPLRARLVAQLGYRVGRRRRRRRNPRRPRLPRSPPPLLSPRRRPAPPSRGSSSSSLLRSERLGSEEDGLGQALSIAPNFACGRGRLFDFCAQLVVWCDSGRDGGMQRASRMISSSRCCSSSEVFRFRFSCFGQRSNVRDTFLVLHDC